MSLSIGFRRVAELIETIEETEATVVDATVPDAEAGDGELLVDMSLAVSLEESQQGVDGEETAQSRSPPTEENADSEARSDEPAEQAVSVEVEGTDDVTGDAADGTEETAADETETDEGSEATKEARSETSDEEGEEGPGTDQAGDAGEDSAPSSSNGAGEATPQTHPSDHDSPEADGEDGDTRTDVPEADDGGPTAETTCPECGKSFESAPGMKIHRTKIHLGSEDEESADGPPQYKDPERLEAVYENNDTFTEMRDALDADVSAQTVRRHAMKHDIHTPDDRDDDSEDPADTDESSPDVTAEDELAESVSAEDQESPTAAGDTDASTDGDEPEPSEPAEREATSDGGTDVESAAEAPSEPSIENGPTIDRVLEPEVELPPDMTVEQLKLAVEEANTLYDVQQAFDLDREAARRLLERFDLLELVHGRVATRDRREELKEEIDRRIRDAMDDAPVAD